MQRDFYWLSRIKTRVFDALVIRGTYAYDAWPFPQRSLVKIMTPRELFDKVDKITRVALISRFAHRFVNL